MDDDDVDVKLTRTTTKTKTKTKLTHESLLGIHIKTVLLAVRGLSKGGINGFMPPKLSILDLTANGEYVAN